MGIFSKNNNKQESGETEKIFEDGLKLMKLNQYDAAIKEFKNALKLNPEKFDITYNIALSFFNSENYKEASNYFDKAIKLKQDNELKSSAYYYKGICFLKNKKSEKIVLKALDCFSKGLEINPKDID